ncbi:MAG TPA: UDP-2,3-diacylglucosamine diphosphatase [Xanthomonadales bacterium]|nr:UDP-2,3-diacylglucosamine diphosphatase [Xanthomonadales bacterium]
MAVLFISDLHLEESRPQISALLLRLLNGPARDADALYILGDLFEFWIGDDVLTETARQVAEGIRRLSDSGVPCYFMHGNRDFLIGTSFTELAGLELLPETLVIDLYGEPTLVLHGDTLCTDDVEYQAFRKQVRNPDWQAMFLAQSVESRLNIAQQARDASKQHTAGASMEIMDVNQKAVIAAFQDHDVNRMIHGHTHRPAFHKHVLDDGSEARRTVLADWYENGSVLWVSEAGQSEQSLEVTDQD